MLTSQEQERYVRQIMMPELGEAGQETLKRSRVLVIGAGGLGSPAAYYLAAAGVGTIGIADGDTVELSNLQRQILHKESRLGQNKAVSAAKSLHGLNAQVHVQTYSQFMDGAHLRQVLPDYDIVIDATDQLENKFLINDVCVSAEKPFVHGGITGFSGQVMTYVPEKGPCYRCIFGEVPEDNAPAPIPVIGVTAGIIGTIQAAEAIRYLLGIPSLLTGKLLVLGRTANAVPHGAVSPHIGALSAAYQKRVTDLLRIPKMILQLKTMLTKFRQNHPESASVFSPAASKAINEGSVIEISLTTAEGRELCTNMRVTQDDLEMIRTLGEMASK